MHAGKNFTLKEALLWTRRDIYKYVIMAAIPTVLFSVFDCHWMAIPWVPIALIGTAVAFLIGFKNNTTYDRLWEARKIWGAIVNNSRSWGIMTKDFVSNKHAKNPVAEEELKTIHRRMIYRHIGWLTALRYQLRQPRTWETMTQKNNVEYARLFHVEELETRMEDTLQKYLPAEEMNYVLSKKNRATQIISLQSAELKQLVMRDLIDDFRHMELQKMLSSFYDEQGKCERLKNFPFPRQFATLNLYFVWLFIILLPFGMLQEFMKMGEHFVWLTIPFSTLVSWVFHTMEKIGESSENPFQGGANDVPITSISRTIEIDLRDMLDEKDLPEPVKVENNILL